MPALICSLCAAPLPPPNDANRTVGCAYCGATNGVPGNGTAFDSARWLKAIEAFKAASSSGATPYQALVATAREQLGPLGETDTLARVVLAMANDFDVANGTSVAKDPMAMSRLIEGYARAIEGIRAAQKHTLELSFFAATKNGPVNFSRALTATEIEQLAAREPNAAPPKKKWWPFG